eukprot:6194795-Pleurochrysis_carterae.AAC.1
MPTMLRGKCARASGHTFKREGESGDQTAEWADQVLCGSALHRGCRPEEVLDGKEVCPSHMDERSVPRDYSICR